ncbi:Thiol:disulfide interchange protein CycY precursor [Planctomycetes bacterium Pan216]|uniref:Thiol:disulfide interchange protein CycY n=1 Tax=Kolteria novifilia TaxID=2527975 RepID=A0A518B284_9BACT|nr:Thiol:disulfide interchange protein CycY precursor [Planctomycetes bacterium Pan216]
MIRNVRILISGLVLLSLSACGKSEPAAQKPNEAGTVKAPAKDEAVAPKKEEKASSIPAADRPTLAPPAPVATTKMPPGDASKTAPPATKPKATDSSAEKGKAASKPADVVLQVVNEKEFDQFLASHKGKYVVIDAWALWCIQCRQKFPKYMELANKKAGEKLVFVTANFDDTDQQEEAQEFLAEQESELKNLLIDASIAKVQEKFKFEGLPQYLIIGPDGEVVFRTSEIENVAPKLDGFGVN